MSRAFKLKFKRRTSEAASPAPQVCSGNNKKIEKTRITIFDYDEKSFREKEAKDIEECFYFKDQPSITWINIDGINYPEILSRLNDYYGLHPVILEDIMNTNQRPKLEDFDDYLYIVLKMLNYDEKSKEIDIEQMSLILGKNFVISFQETEGDVFDSIRERIRTGRGRVRKNGADYLAYVLLDAIIDSYFFILEDLGEGMEILEQELIIKPTPETLHNINKFKNEMTFIRKSIWPLRELIIGLERADSHLIKKSTDIYLRNLYEHAVQIIDTIETFRDMLAGMIDIYLSSVSNKTNDVVRILTIITTIFMPLSVIVGFYGMNFKYLPELEASWGYLGVLGLMLVIAIAMVIGFKKRRWL